MQDCLQAIPQVHWRHQAGSVWLLFFFLLSALNPSADVLALEHSSRPCSSDSAGSGASYWGTIPSQAESITARMVQPGSPAWEKAVTFPYKIVGFPLSALKLGLRETVIFLDERRIIGMIQRLIGPQPGPFGVALTFEAGGLSGFGGGLTVSHDSFLRPGNRFKLRWKSTVRHDHRVTLGMHLRNQDATSIVLGAGYRHRPNARYFGLGPSSADSLESFYAQEIGWGGLAYRASLLTTVYMDALALFSGVGAFHPKNDDKVPIGDRHPLPNGYKERSDGLTLALSLVRDTTYDDGWVEVGAVQRVKASFFRETNRDKIDFWTLRGEIQQFIPLPYSQQVVAVRGHLTWIETGEHVDLPFQRLLTNDDPDLLRGYRDFRWRDRGLTALSVEYRWPLWAYRHANDLGLGGYLFTDIGQVFSKFRQISRDHLTSSFGGGVRLVGTKGFLGRFEVGWSDEETVIRLRADQTFQFERAGLIHGRDQVALR